MTEPQTITDILKQRPLFQCCAPDFIEALAKQSHIHQAPKGKLLFIHHDPATYFFILSKGWVKLFKETLDGTQAVIDILPPYHMFGETSLFDTDTYPYSAEAIENIEYISLPLSALKTEIEQNAQFAVSMLTSMARYRKQQDLELEHRTLQNAPQRIGCFLLRLVDQNQTGPVTIHLPYDKTLVASRLGMQPETFSRALGKLKEETGITVKGATVHIDHLDQLSHYACAACSSSFPCKDLNTKTACAS